jgi:Ca2+-binding RTX toxin-like protein
VNLSLSSGQIINDGFGNRETALSIEDITGSDFVDMITGNAADNVITGGAGFDVLKGGAGADRFQLFGVLDVGDTIQDFVSGADKLVISTTASAGMTGGTFRNGATPSGTGSSFYYNASNDTLFWDRDGTGSIYAPVVLAVLTNVSSMAMGDILLA